MRLKKARAPIHVIIGMGSQQRPAGGSWGWKPGTRLLAAAPRTDLKSMGVDPDMFWQNLNVSVEAVKGANTTQEMMKAQLKRQTEVVNVADRNNYSLTTSYIDVISGAYEMFTPEAKQLRRLRSQLHRPITPPKQA